MKSSVRFKSLDFLTKKSIDLNHDWNQWSKSHWFKSANRAVKKPVSGLVDKAKDDAASTSQPVAEGSLRLNGCYEDILGHGVNGRGFRRWRCADRWRTDAVVPARLIVTASSSSSSDSGQHEVVVQRQSRVMLSAQEVDVVAASLTVPDTHRSVREYVFYVFFRFKKTWLSTFFWNDLSKNVISR